MFHILLFIYFLSITNCQSQFDAQVDIRFIEDTLRNKFAQARHNNVVQGSNRAKEYIRDHINSLKMFKFEQKLEPLTGDGSLDNGINIAGILEGQFRNTSRDQILVVGAHYDTRSQAPGVVDNGSGCAGLFELMRIISKQKALFNGFTIYFVFFDYTIDVLGGSRYFVEIEIIVQRFSKKKGHFLGFINLDMVLIHNTNPQSQYFYDEFRTDNAAEIAKVQQDQSKGDFVAMISRNKFDDTVADRVLSAHKKMSSGFQLKLVELKRDLPEFGPDLASSPNYTYNLNKYTFHSDHYHFWYPGGRKGVYSSKYTLPAIWLTDTGRQRSPFRSCSDLPTAGCDGKQFASRKNVEFLAKIVELVARTLFEYVQNPPAIPTIATTTTTTTTVSISQTPSKSLPTVTSDKPATSEISDSSFNNTVDTATTTVEAKSNSILIIVGIVILAALLILGLICGIRSKSAKGTGRPNSVHSPKGKSPVLPSVAKGKSRL
ncbi:hypothetical protein HDE_03141 [Halotydeus destructor]|nr:hypothetical protein HDE_03141 [Halotydeus destructor]